VAHPRITCRQALRRAACAASWRRRRVGAAAVAASAHPRPYWQAGPFKTLGPRTSRVHGSRSFGSA
jgi:hypothetical protein